MPENFLIQKSGCFQGFSGIFQVEKGIFKSPLLCPHPLPSSEKTRIFYPYRTPKIPGKERKTMKKTRNSSQGKKQGISRKQGKEGQGNTWWTFRILFIFLIGGREGAVRGARKGGGRFSLKISGGRGVSQEGGGWARGPGGCLRGIWGGGAIFFSSGPKCPPSFVCQDMRI